MLKDVILPEVTRFIVKVPAQMDMHQIELRQRLKENFPAKTFLFEMAGDSGKAVALVPVMEDSNGRAHLCRAPERSLISRIYETINDCVVRTRISPA